MIDTALIQSIDVNQYFFGIDEINFKKFEYVFDDEKGLLVSMNHVISKPCAIEKACQMFWNERNEFARLYVSVDSMKVEYMRDYLGKRIFKHLQNDISGWLFLFDPMPFANWEHPCQYLLIVNNDCVEQISHVRGVADTIQLEKIY